MPQGYMQRCRLADLVKRSYDHLRHNETALPTEPFGTGADFAEAVASGWEKELVEHEAAEHIEIFGFWTSGRCSVDARGESGTSWPVRSRGASIMSRPWMYWLYSLHISCSLRSASCTLSSAWSQASRHFFTLSLARESSFSFRLRSVVAYRLSQNVSKYSGSGNQVFEALEPWRAT